MLFSFRFIFSYAFAVIFINFGLISQNKVGHCDRNNSTVVLRNICVTSTYWTLIFMRLKCRDGYRFTIFALDEILIINLISLIDTFQRINYAIDFTILLLNDVYWFHWWFQWFFLYLIINILWNKFPTLIIIIIYINQLIHLV